MRRTYLIAVLAAVAIAAIYVTIVLKIDSNHRAHLELERQRADQAMSNLGGTYKYYIVEQTPDGLKNRLDLAPREKVTNQNIHFLRGLSSIRGLDLSSGDISDSGLDPVRGLKDLESLQLARTKVTDVGVKSLLVLENLEAIDLSFTRVTAKSEEYLAKFPKLKLVFAAGTDVSNVKGVIIDKDPNLRTWVAVSYRKYLAPTPAASATSSTGR